MNDNGRYSLRFTLNPHDDKDCDGTSRTESSLTHVSEYQVSREAILKYLGPDEIFVEISGKTMQSFLPTYVGCGTYSVEFFIKQSGVYHLSIVKLRSDYTAVNEVDKIFPLFEYQTLVAEWFWLDQNKIPEGTCPYGNSQGVWSIKEENVDQARGVYDKLALAKNTVPSILERDSNATIPMYVNLTDSYPLTHHCVDKVSQYGWDPQDCGQNFITHAEAGKLLERKRVVFSGDSQMRTLAVSFFHFACGAPLTFNNRIPSFYLPKTHAQCRGLSMSYVNNAYCNAAELPRGEGVDLLVANCGHHPASGTGAQYPIPKYVELVENFTQALPTRGYTPRNMVWMESLPLPLRKDQVVIDVCDWRTFDRIRIFNTLANHILGSRDFPVLSVFLAMLPLANKLCDNAHYTSLHSNDPIIQQILSNLLHKR